MSEPGESAALPITELSVPEQPQTKILLPVEGAQNTDVRPIKEKKPLTEAQRLALDAGRAKRHAKPSIPPPPTPAASSESKPEAKVETEPMEVTTPTEIAEKKQKEKRRKVLKRKIVYETYGEEDDDISSESEEEYEPQKRNKTQPSQSNPTSINLRGRVSTIRFV